MTKSSRRFVWATGIATTLAMLGTVMGRRVSQRVEDVSFGSLLILLVLFVVMAWWRVQRSWKDDLGAWRVWVSVAGCVALTLAFGLPLIPFLGSIVFGMGFGPRWDYKLLMFGFGVGAVVLGIPSDSAVRVPLIAGGGIVALVGLILPVGV